MNNQMNADLEYITDGKRHLICRPYSVLNLHRMAEDLDIKRCWFHAKGKTTKLPHYDIPLRRKKEIEDVCNKVTPRVLSQIIKDGLNPLPDEMWMTREGRLIAVGDMSEDHVRNTLRMLIRVMGKKSEAERLAMAWAIAGDTAFVERSSIKTERTALDDLDEYDTWGD